jgi:hypothetical protein
VEVRGALGHGRSYGMRSRILVRAIPGILESGLWAALAGAEPRSTTALVTDVGNDVAYGVEPDTIVSWVEECVIRLQQLGAEILLTDLPTVSLASLGRLRYQVFRRLLVPSCRLDLDEVRRRAGRVVEGLAALCRRRGVRLFHLRDEWYGVDPIHIRRRLWGTAWTEILATAAGSAQRADGDRIAARSDWLRCYLARPETEWLLGLRRRRRQPALTLETGSQLFLY